MPVSQNILIVFTVESKIVPAPDTQVEEYFKLHGLIHENEVQVYAYRRFNCIFHILFTNREDASYTYNMIAYLYFANARESSV